MGKPRRTRPNVPPPTLQYGESARKVSNVGHNGSNSNGTHLKASSSTLIDQSTTTPMSERRGILLLAAACFLLWFLYTPKLLHRAGVIDKDPYQQFLHEMVYPELQRGMAKLNATFADVEHASKSSESARPGYKLKEQGIKAKHPIVMVPGFVTSGLELWEGEDCAKKHFRQRLWGSVSMATTFFQDRECWRRHLSLDPYTGSDPPSVRLRAAQGFEAADYFMANYWVWSKLIENFADVGYDGSLMTMASYDWRLAYPLLEERDGYFTKLQYTIEAYVKTKREKVVLISHSMGGTVVIYFLNWVTANAGKDWVEKHIHSFVNIAGTLLGVPKAVPALLSGELKDTAALLSQLGLLLEQYFGKRLRKNLWNSWGSLFGMLPSGGDAIWGVGADMCSKDQIASGLDCLPRSSIEDKKKSKVSSVAPMIMWNSSSPTCTDKAHVPEALPPVPDAAAAWSTQETLDYIQKSGGGYGPTLSSSKLFSFDSQFSRKPKKEQWHNPMATSLPKAPSMKLYCMYGAGIPTERAYFYKNACESSDPKDKQVSQCDEDPSDTPFSIDTDAKDESLNITYGVKFADGDGSVPLVSLGYMCEHWKKGGKHNPSKLQVVTREHLHQAELQLNDPGRGGPRSGEHVDILGHLNVIEDILSIVTDHETDSITDQIVSDLKRIVSDIDEHSRRK